MAYDGDFSRSPLRNEVLYFAYGSNMFSEVFEERRGVVALETSPAVAFEQRLAFSAAGIPPFEPAFASIEPDFSECCHGVLYRISVWDWARLQASEGAIPGTPVGYQVVKLPVTPYGLDLPSRSPSETGEGALSITAFTLRFQQPHLAFAKTFIPLPGLPKTLPVWESPPSRRYLGLLTSGARQKGVAEVWQQKLASIEPARWT